MSSHDKTRDYIEREKAAIFTTTLDTSLVLTRGKGVSFVGLDGRRYIDCTSQISLLNTGYNPKKVLAYIKAQLESGIHSCISADWAFCKEMPDGAEISRAALAEELIKISDSVMPKRRKKVMFEATGALAVNAAAVIAAITYNRKFRKQWTTDQLKESFLHQDVFVPCHHTPFSYSFLSFKNAFHGRHGVAKDLTDSKAVQKWGPASSCAIGRLTLPYDGWLEEDMIGEVVGITERLRSHAPIVAFFFEPIQGEGGINVPNPEILRKLISLLRSWGVFIIADEIQTGLGRTGKMFGCEHFGIQPDMVLLSKSLGAGLPISAVIADADMFPDLEPGMHSGSMHCTPLACAAAMANLQLIKANLKNAERMGEHTGRLMRLLIELSPAVVKDVRGLGLFWGIEFFKKEYRDRVIELAKVFDRNVGLLLAPCGERVIRFCPPLVIGGEDLDIAISIFSGAIAESC